MFLYFELRVVGAGGVGEEEETSALSSFPERLQQPWLGQATYLTRPLLLPQACEQGARSEMELVGLQPDGVLESGRSWTSHATMPAPNNSFERIKTKSE